jgi:hypothetical protein
MLTAMNTARHHLESDRTVIKAAPQKVAKHARGRWKYRKDRHRFLRRMLDYHHKARNLAATLRI